ncbi:metallophosphoesterase [Sphingomonas sp. CGMCC 1.13654]|uniref:Metallophosphoesterase n=1 Tax=Sphingomonas chungangi TaxID=2683589 RepID=A0A838LC35_9SPHN|nr:metallophosphoesterase [Sphingomonas chungangi]MBA2936420.1 metallophosphoesterase [Sphingomonas chungangi]MVW55805.1 metallophosphoesterase [Sphingomonas chungangi]
MDDHDILNPRVDRRGMLTRCAGWAGTAALYTVSGGIVSSMGLDAALAGTPRPGRTKPFTFLQISDTHIGFDKAANPDARGTAIKAVERIRALPVKPDLILHTGDITHLSKDEQFDDAKQILSDLGAPIFFVPGEHDFLDEGQGKAYLAHHGQGTLGSGWQSFDHDGVHFVGLNNVAALKPGGMAHLGDDQLAWLAKDLAPLSASTPIVVFGHIPLWTVYEAWGWGTDDSAQALALLARFGSVTVLNGHIHQIISKVEGNVTFHSARSTAYPQPAPGAAPSPGPLKVPTEQLPSMLGIRSALFRRGSDPIALIEQTLA